MAKRLTDTDIWDKEWFMVLSPKLKCLVKFVRDKCDLAGVWCPNWMLVNTYIGEKVSEEELLSIDGGNQFVKLPSGKIFCIDFIKFQNGELNDKSPVHVKIKQLLLKHDIPYPYPMNRVLDTPLVVVKVKVKEEVRVIKAQQDLIYPFDSKEFKTAWESLLAEKKWRKKSKLALEMALKKLSKYTEQEAIEMIEAAIAGEWQGIHEIKSTNKTGNGKQSYIDRLKGF